MSTNQKTWTDGEAITTTESNRVARIAATMDDRAWEPLFTPGSVQKKIIPLSEESASVNPRLLMVPGVTAGAVKLMPSLFLAGGVSLPNHLNMAAKLEAALDSAIFASNASGSTRYDLVYATISYAVSVTGSRKVKDVSTALVSTQVLNLEKVPQVVLTVLANVSNVTPTSGMPADPGDGSAYNFPLCYVALPNGYTATTVITQSQVTHLWSGSWLAPQRVHGMRPMSVYAGAGVEKPSGSLPLLDRWGADSRFFGHFKVTSGTPGGATPPGDVLDSTIDWRSRFVSIQLLYMGSALNFPLETAVSPAITMNFSASTLVQSTNFAAIVAFAGANAAVLAQITYAAGAQIFLYVHSDGSLRVYRSGSLIDGTNGDAFVMLITASDKFVGGM